jgi:hypothetical protein
VEKINKTEMRMAKLIAMDSESPKKISFGIIKKSSKTSERNAPIASQRKMLK